jgi:hypothetical protein
VSFFYEISDEFVDVNKWIFSPLYEKYGTGTTVFSALAGGLLTGKVGLFLFVEKISSMAFNQFLVNSTTMVFLKDRALLPISSWRRQPRVGKRQLKARKRSGKSESCQR